MVNYCTLGTHWQTRRRAEAARRIACCGRCSARWALRIAAWRREVRGRRLTGPRTTSWRPWRRSGREVDGAGSGLFFLFSAFSAGIMHRFGFGGGDFDQWGRIGQRGEIGTLIGQIEIILTPEKPMGSEIS